VEIKLPNRIFFTGVPGSRWSGIAQTLEMMSGMNTSDRTPEREYVHHSYTGHKGAYFGPGMEFEPILDGNYIDQAWIESNGCKLVKSHEWSYYLDQIREKFPDDWIILVYRPDMSSYAWWHEAGGFQIKYPNYSHYQNSNILMSEIMKQNSSILEFGMKNDCKWEYFTSRWIEENFNQSIKNNVKTFDVLVTCIK
jgi:hypothetical protein